MGLLLGQYVDSQAMNNLQNIQIHSSKETAYDEYISYLLTKSELKGEVFRIYCSSDEAAQILKNGILLSYGLLVKRGVSGGLSIIGEHQFLRLINTGLVTGRLYNELLIVVLNKAVILDYIPVSGVIPKIANLLFLITDILRTVENVSKLQLESYMYHLIGLGLLSREKDSLIITERGRTYLRYFKLQYLYADSTALLDFLMKRRSFWEVRKIGK